MSPLIWLDRLRTGVTEPRSVAAGIVVAGFFVLALELVWTFVTGLSENAYLSVPSYLTHVTAITLVVWTVHAGAAWAIFELARRLGASPLMILATGAAAFGLLTQYTMIQGDGFASLRLYALYRVAFVVLFPAGFVIFTWAIFQPRFPAKQRVLLAVITLVGAAVFNLLVLNTYQQFHGYLAVFNAAVVLFLTRPLWGHPYFRRAAVGLAAVGLVAVAVTLPNHEGARTQVQRFSHLPASMLAGLPLGGLLSVAPQDLFDLEGGDEAEIRAFYERHFGQDGMYDERPRRGDNVLLIVLESVRADYWDDPELTPYFHRWKQEGVHFPRAVAQYPATPLAYGAMFTAQPPSVVAQTPYWGQNRLFERIIDRFDHILLTRPDISWFEHTAITDFFIPRDHPVNAHPTGPEGLRYLQEQIRGFDDGESFFAWVHLYEPHSPYKPREPWAEEGDGRMSRYRSEIAYTDQHLGRFMEWFFDQPHAEETLVILISDHGQGMGEEILGRPFWGHHVHVHNVVSHVPMFVSGPGLDGGERDEDLGVMQLDVMPTIFDFVGAPMPEGFTPQGNSVYHLLKERPLRPMVTEAFSIRGTPFFDFVANTQQGDDLSELRREFQRISTRGQRYSPKTAVQYGDHKFIYDRLLQHGWVYDISKESHEEVDLTFGEPEVAREMEEMMQSWYLLQGQIVEWLDDL